MNGGSADLALPPFCNLCRHNRVRTNVQLPVVRFGTTVSALLPCVIAVCALSACARPTQLGQTASRDQLYASLVGQWKGTLTVPIAFDSDVLRTQATRLEVVPAPDTDGLELRYAMLDDAPAPVVDHLHLDRTMRLARVGRAGAPALPAFAVRELGGGRDGAPLRLVLEADGTENDDPVRIRETIELSAGEMQVRTEARAPGGSWRLRRKHAFRRAE